MSLRRVKKDSIVTNSGMVTNSTQLEGIISKIKGNNVQLATAINEIISDAHLKFNKNTQIKHYNLLRDIIEGDEKYEYLLKVIYDSDFKTSIRNLISQGIGRNLNLTDSEKIQIRQWFKELLESEDVQKSLGEKIVVDNSDVKTELSKIDVKRIQSSLIDNVLSNGKVVGRVNSCISSFQRSLNSQSYQKIIGDINKIFTDYKQHIDKINKVVNEIQTITPSTSTASISNGQVVQATESFDTSRRIQSERKRKRYIIGYNALILSLFKGRIKELKAKSVDKVVAHVLAHDIHKRIRKFIRGINPFSGIRNLKKLKSWKFWKGLVKKSFVGLGKFFMRSLFILPLMLGAGLFKFTIGTGVFAIKTGFSTLAFLVKLPFKMINTTCLILRGLLKTSFALVKKSLSFGNNILGRIKAFLFNPVGAYITGFVIGFLWEKMKQLWGGFVDWTKEIEEAIKKWLKEKDESLRQKYTAYDKFRTDVDTKIENFRKWSNGKIFAKDSDFAKLKDDLLDISNAETEEEREATREQLYKDLNERLGWDKKQEKIADGSLEALEWFNKLFSEGSFLQEFMEGFKNFMNGKYLNEIADDINHFGWHGGFKVAAGKTVAGSGAILASTIIGGLLGSALGPVGTYIGTSLGSMLGTILGEIISRKIGDIPYIGEIEANQVKALNEKYLSKVQSKQNSISPKDLIITKNDKRQKRISQLKEIIQDRVSERPNEPIESHSKAEIEELKRLLDEESQNSVIRAMDSKERLTDANNMISRFSKLSEIQDGIALAYVNDKELLNAVFGENYDINKLVEGKKFSKVKYKRELQQAKIKFVGEVVMDALKAYSDGNITKEDAEEYIGRQIHAFDTAEIDVEWSEDEIDQDGKRTGKKVWTKDKQSIRNILQSTEGQAYQTKYDAKTVNVELDRNGIMTLESGGQVDFFMNLANFKNNVNDMYNGEMYRNIIRNTVIECNAYRNILPKEEFITFVIERINKNFDTYEKLWGKNRERKRENVKKVNPISKWTIRGLYEMAGLNTKDKTDEMRKKLLEWVEENGEKNGIEKEWFVEQLKLEDIETLDSNIRIKRAQNDYMKDKIEENLQSNPVVVIEEESEDDPISTMEPPEEAER